MKLIPLRNAAPYLSGISLSKSYELIKKERHPPIVKHGISSLVIEEEIIIFNELRVAISRFNGTHLQQKISDLQNRARLLNAGHESKWISNVVSDNSINSQERVEVQSA